MRIIPREPSDDYDWCNNFVIVPRRVIANVTRNAPPESRAQLLGRGWRPNLGIANCYYRYVGRACLWVAKHAHGWVIELTHPSDTDARVGPRILTTCLGDMPVLCPTLSTAVQFAEASYPRPYASLQLSTIWRSNW
jgi:hypothetical protein